MSSTSKLRTGMLIVSRTVHDLGDILKWFSWLVEDATAFCTRWRATTLVGFLVDFWWSIQSLIPAQQPQAIFSFHYRGNILWH